MDTKYKIQALIVVLVLIIGIGFAYRTTNTSREELKAKYKQEISSIESSFKMKLDQERMSSTSTITQLQADISTRESQYQSKIRELKSKTEIITTKVVRPDGTIEERTIETVQTTDVSSSIQEVKKEYEAQFKEQEIAIRQEYERAILDQQKEYSEQLTSYDEEIRILKTQTTTSIERKFSLGGGILNDGSKYLSTTYDVLGPFFIGSQVEQYQDKYRFGIGIGVKF